MNNKFEDITSVMGKPDWYDLAGYPRYGKFKPDNHSNIYADIVILFRIGCQACAKEFNVAEAFTIYQLYENKNFKAYMQLNKVGENEPLTKHLVPFIKSLSPEDLMWLIHYGDPPNHGCVGDTMNCEDNQILEFWYRESSKWKRINELEITLEIN